MVAVVGVARHPRADCLAATDNSKLPNADFDNYYNIGTRPGRPYVDFPVEFPVATAQTFRTLAPICRRSRAVRRQPGHHQLGRRPGDRRLRSGLGMGDRAAACYAFVVIPLLDLFFLRMDLWSTALATFAAAAWRRERPVFAAIGLGGRRRVQAVAADVSPAPARAVEDAASTDRAARDGHRGRTGGPRRDGYGSPGRPASTRC